MFINLETNSPSNLWENLPNTPFLYSTVNVYWDKRFSVYPFNISLSVNHLVELKGETTWGTIYSIDFVSMTSDVNEIYVGIRDLIRRFVKEYIEVNDYGEGELK